MEINAKVGFQLSFLVFLCKCSSMFGTQRSGPINDRDRLLTVKEVDYEVEVEESTTNGSRVVH